MPPERTIAPPVRRETEVRRFAAILEPNACLADQIDFLGGFNVQACDGPTLAAMAATLRQRCLQVKGLPPQTIDLCGTGGDGSGTFNISTLAACVTAGAGIPVAKHGNGSISSRCGSADCLTELGVSRIDQPKHAARLIRAANIAFLYAPDFHPAVRQVMPARRQLSARGRKTLFHVLGPLIHPAAVSRQAVGVFTEALIEPMAQALADLGVHRALVYHGSGLDEITLCGTTRYACVEGQRITLGTWTPADFGLPACRLADISGGDVVRNAEIARAVLGGTERGPRRDIVILNAAAGIWVGDDQAAGVPECLERAADALDSGRALDCLQTLIKESQLCRAC